MYVRITDKHLIDALRDQEMVGNVRVAAFARQGATSASSSGSASGTSTSSEDDMPVSDHTVPAAELEKIGTLAQLKGMTWSKQNEADVVRLRPSLARSLSCSCQHSRHVVPVRRVCACSGLSVCERRVCIGARLVGQIGQASARAAW